MNKFLKNWFWALVVIAVIPTIFRTVWAQWEIDDTSTYFLKKAVFWGALLLGGLWLIRTLGLAEVLQRLFQAIGGFFHWLFFGGDRWAGARYMSAWEAWGFFNRGGHTGFLVDGRQRRLSAKVSYQSCATVAGMGAGKTSAFVFPNLYTLDDCSLVITDTSGELFEQSSGYLAKRGFDIKVLNLMEPTRSHGFNPLATAHSFTEIAGLAHLLIRSSPASGAKDDAYWTAGAEKLVRIIIQCLKNAGDQRQQTLAEVKARLSLFDHFTAKPGESVFDQWVLENTLEDPATWQDYKSLIASPEKVVSSFLSTADVALMALGNPALAALTERHELDFAAMRTRKTALYIMVRQQDMSLFGFLLSAVFSQCFNSFLSELNRDHLPVYCLLDEFGQTYIPGFDTIATTARKYRVALWVFLQSLGQLEARYSRAQAQTILGGIRTEIHLAGLELETAERISRRLGRKRSVPGQAKVSPTETALMNADEIITMKGDEALLLHANLRPFRYRVTSYYRQGRFRRLAKIPPVELPRFRTGHAEEDEAQADIDTTATPTEETST